MEYAMKAHSGQYRKGTRIPYIYHPLNVGRILFENEYSNEIVIAGFLHDTVEDTPVSFNDINSVFGEYVAFLVENATEEDKNDTWENRKNQTIEKLKTAQEDVLALSCADKLDNIRSIHQDYNRIGEELWKRFNRSKEKQRWYYTSLASVFNEKKKEIPHFSLASEFIEEVERVF